MFKRSQFSFFVVLVLAALILPEIFRDGIFMDGNLYASVSVNFARGEGNFWSPHFSKTSMTFFHEQPPLMFGLLGICYKIFGEHMLVERFYSLAIFILSVIVFLKIWKELFPSDHALHTTQLLALLVWMIIPNSFWVVIHNLEENTMGLFVLLTIFLQLKGCKVHFSRAVFLLLLSSVTLFCAFLTKGFPGLFPIIFYPLLLFFSEDSFAYPKRTGIIVYLFFIFSFALMLMLVFIHPVSAPLMNSWLYERVINSIQNVSTTQNRFGILFFLLMQLVPVFVLFLVIGALSQWKKVKPVFLLKADFRNAIIFLILALAGSVPLVVTREQRGFYLATSFPYYAIALTLFIAPYCGALKKENWTQTWLTRFKAFNYFFAAIILLVTVYFLPVPKRDPGKFHDYKILTSKLNFGQYLVVGGEMWNDWELQTAMVRNKYVSLTSDTSVSDFLLLDQQAKRQTDTTNFVQLDWDLRWYSAYCKK